MTIKETVELISQAIIRMEGGIKPSSINARMVKERGLWNVGHLTWAKQRNAVPVKMGDRTWAGWPTREESVNGVRRDVAAKIRVGMSIRSLITAYAPPVENNTEAYVRFVAQQTGIPDGTPIKELVK